MVASFPGFLLKQNLRLMLWLQIPQRSINHGTFIDLCTILEGFAHTLHYLKSVTQLYPAHLGTGICQSGCGRWACSRASTRMVFSRSALGEGGTGGRTAAPSLAPLGRFLARPSQLQVSVRGYQCGNIQHDFIT